MNRRRSLAIVCVLALGAAGGLLLNAQSPATQPAAVEPARPCTPAIIEVLMPGAEAGHDVDAVWQRKILTTAARLRFTEVLERALLRDNVRDATHENKPGIPRTAEALNRCLTVRQIPGTALLEVWVDCSSDRATCATVTADLVDEFHAQLLNDVTAKLAHDIDILKEARTKIADSVATSHSVLEDFIAVHNIDAPPAPATQPDGADAKAAQRDHARWVRELAVKKRQLAVSEAVEDEYSRRVTEANLAAAANVEDLGVRIVQRPTP